MFGIRVHGGHSVDESGAIGVPKVIWGSSATTAALILGQRLEISPRLRYLLDGQQGTHSYFIITNLQNLVIPRLRLAGACRFSGVSWYLVLFGGFDLCHRRHRDLG